MTRWLARWKTPEPLVTEPHDDLDAALTTLDVDVDTTTVAGLGEAVFGGLTLVSLVVAGLASPPLQVPVVLLGVGLALGCWWLVTVGPVVLATARRRRALGTAPWLVCRAAMRLRLTPTPAAAAAFAARGDDRLLFRRLAVHVRRARGRPESPLDEFRAEWGDRFPPLDRALASLQTAVATPEDDRSAMLGRALDTVLDGVQHRAADDAATLQGPVTALYAFGVLLPLALVAALPAAAMAGVPVTVPLLVVGYDALLPLLVLVGSAWVIARRPVTAPVVTVPRDHPDVPGTKWRPVVFGVASGTVAAIVAGRLVGVWVVPVAACGVGVGVTLATGYRHERVVRARMVELEASLPALLTRVGHAVADGTPVERALATARGSTDGPDCELLDAGVDRMVQFGVGVEAAFLGERGALATIPSRRAEVVVRLLAAAASEGAPAGSALVATGRHLTALQRVERETQRSLRRLTSTMGNTATVFGPLVGGVTVALAGRLHGSALGGGLRVETLGPVVGWYVLALAVILTALATGLHRGFDRAVVGYRVGLALPAATVTYVAALHVTRLVA